MSNKSLYNTIALLTSFGITIVLNAPKLLVELRADDSRILGDFNVQSYFIQIAFTFIYAYLLFILNLKQQFFNIKINNSPKFIITNLFIFLILTILMSSINIRMIGLKEALTFFRGGYLIRNLLATVIVMLISKMMLLIKEYQDNLLKSKTAEAAKNKAEFETLRNQIAPHVLFNSLNTINFLTRTDPQKSVEYVNKLSSFLRNNLQENQPEELSIHEELKNLNIYLSLLNERYGGIISIKTEIPDSVLEQKILRFTLQELLENAVKHNVVRKTNPLLLHITYSPDGNVIEVKNKMSPKIGEVHSSGTGLNNLCFRYEYLHQKKIRIMNDNHFFLIKIPVI